MPPGVFTRPPFLVQIFLFSWAVCDFFFCKVVEGDKLNGRFEAVDLLRNFVLSVAVRCSE